MPRWLSSQCRRNGPNPTSWLSYASTRMDPVDFRRMSAAILRRIPATSAISLRQTVESVAHRWEEHFGEKNKTFGPRSTLLDSPKLSQTGQKLDGICSKVLGSPVSSRARSPLPIGATAFFGGDRAKPVFPDRTQANCSAPLSRILCDDHRKGLEFPPPPRGGGGLGPRSALCWFNSSV